MSELHVRCTVTLWACILADKFLGLGRLGWICTLELHYDERTLSLDKEARALEVRTLCLIQTYVERFFRYQEEREEPKRGNAHVGYLVKSLSSEINVLCSPIHIFFWACSVSHVCKAITAERGASFRGSEDKRAPASRARAASLVMLRCSSTSLKRASEPLALRTKQS